ncbi:MAG: hypothetical protein SGI74_02745 [Oligoflexia bacterium]|nr:hypothetical protein [Oligoflexia bacterium]
MKTFLFYVFVLALNIQPAFAESQKLDPENIREIETLVRAYLLGDLSPFSNPNDYETSQLPEKLVEQLNNPQSSKEGRINAIWALNNMFVKRIDDRALAEVKAGRSVKDFERGTRAPIDYHLDALIFSDYDERFPIAEFFLKAISHPDSSVAEIAQNGAQIIVNHLVDIALENGSLKNQTGTYQRHISDAINILKAMGTKSAIEGLERIVKTTPGRRDHVKSQFLMPRHELAAFYAGNELVDMAMKVNTKKLSNHCIHLLHTSLTNM